MEFAIFLQAAPGGDYTFLIFMGIMFVVLYFFMIRPQQKKQKDAKKYREAIKRGDEIVTIGGIHGVVSSVESEDTLLVEIERGIKVKIEKWAISTEASKKTSDIKKD